jgi:hypothetical protein
MAAPDIISLHTAVGSLAGTDAYFRKAGFAGPHSHFGVGGNGEVWQWQDTAYRAAANYNGNHHIISVETADRGAPFADWNINDGSAVPAWTPAQCESLAQLIAAMCKAHNIPCVLIPDAKPGRRGIGFHRQGVPGYMVAGAEQWSTAQGKVCPGNRRIAQIPSIIARAQNIMKGVSRMATLDQEDLTNIARAVWGFTTSGQNIQAQDRLTGIDGLTQIIANRQVGYGNRIEHTEALVAAIQGAVVQLAGASGGLSPDEIEALVKKILAENVVKVDVGVGARA